MFAFVVSGIKHILYSVGLIMSQPSTEHRSPAGSVLAVNEAKPSISARHVSTISRLRGALVHSAPLHSARRGPPMSLKTERHFDVVSSAAAFSTLDGRCAARGHVTAARWAATPSSRRRDEMEARPPSNHIDLRMLRLHPVVLKTVARSCTQIRTGNGTSWCATGIRRGVGFCSTQLAQNCSQNISSYPRQ